MTKRSGALLLALTLLGGALGERAIPGRAPDAAALAPPAARETGPLGGRFWRPAASDAARPTLRLDVARWTPERSPKARPLPGAFASLGAMVRLAALD